LPTAAATGDQRRAAISEKTVKTHVSNILDKLHLADRTQAAIYAFRERIVPLDGPARPS
jgi:hypothetical protein